MDNPEDNSTANKKQKDLIYKQQQQRLQSIAIKSKELSADDLIRNKVNSILEKVDSDAKISKLYVPQQQRNSQPAPSSSSIARPREYTESSSQQQPPQQSSNNNNSLPIPPCFLSCNELPPIYSAVWNAAKQSHVPDSQICDRDKLYQVLLLSNLPSHVLAQLWAFVNRTIPGQLTRSELFVMLGLISLIQTNHPDPVNELYKTATIPLPNFPQFNQPPATTNSTNPFCENVEQPINNAPIETTEPVPNNPEDDFADFKSAEFDDFVGATVESTEPSNDFDFPSPEKVEAPPPPPPVLETPTESKDDLNSSIAEFISINSSPVSQELSSINANNSSSTSSELIVESQQIEPQSLWLNTSSKGAEQTDKDNNDNDRYRSLRRLTTTANQRDSEEFGDFYSHSTTDCDSKSPEDLLVPTLKASDISAQAISNKRKVLNAICKLMQKTFNILVVNHGEESVREALRSKDGTNFANDLSEVFAVAQRIAANLSVLNNPTESDQCNSVFEEISNKWNLIHNLFRKSSVEFDADKAADSHLMVVEQSAPPVDRCTICSAEWSHQSSGSLLFAGFRYHSSCANFWLNFVAQTLPHKHYDDDF